LKCIYRIFICVPSYQRHQQTRGVASKELTMTATTGIHHITAIAGDVNRNIAFYRDFLGLRLVKKTVNFDDPSTYHLYFGDEAGSPGTILTFFYWKGIGKGRAGAGSAVEIAFAIPRTSLGFWIDRLIAKGITHDSPKERFGETVIGFRDPDGLFLELVAREDAAAIAAHAVGDIPAEHAIRGFSGVTQWVDQPEATHRLLTNALGFVEAGKDDNRVRFIAKGPGLATRVDLRLVAGFPPGAMGAGTIHHIAFRADDDADQTGIANAIRALHIGTTEQKDRSYFRSIYLREPGGVIYEIATDAPGFAVDEAPDLLGTDVKLPAQFEPHRAKILAALPELI
jgi:glyoxalase family protein